MPLYHFSEDAGIRVFHPHVPAHRPEVEALVWAIDEWHAPMYYFPRDCPRACFWPGPQTSDDDRERWFGGIEAKMVIAVESRWLDAIRNAMLYRYTFDESGFTPQGDGSGHWVSRETTAPVAVEPVGDLLTALIDAGIELRITPTLLELWRRVIHSTLSFSGTRLRNAAGWTDDL